MNDPAPTGCPDNRGPACRLDLLRVVFVAGVVLAINFVLELLHRLLNRMTGVRDDLRVSLSWPPGFPRTKYRLSPASIRRSETQP